MRYFILLLATFLFAVEVKIDNVDLKNKEITLNKYVKKGVSGVVICNYLKTPIICARAVSFGKIAKLFVYDDLKNDAFARPVVLPKKNDEVVFAKDYSRIVIIAPNQEIYLKLKNLYKNNVIISPDVLAAFLDGEINQNNLREFAKEFNIGRYIIALDKVYEVDSFSFYIVGEKNFKINAKYNKAFFTYSNNFDIKKVDFKKLIKGIDD